MNRRVFQWLGESIPGKIEKFETEKKVEK